MSDPFVGEIRVVGFNFQPKGWASCDGRLLPIQQYSALFALLGTTFGGNGSTTFALPDYRGRSPVGMGNGPGLTPVVQGEMAGSQSVTILPTQMPMHSHAATGIQPASTASSSVASPQGGIPAITVSEDGRTQFFSYAPAASADTTLAPVAITVQPAGGSQPLPILNPFLGSNFIIALEGIFPSRN